MKKNAVLIFSFSLALALGLNIYFRSFPINFPQLKTQARKTVEDTLTKQALEDTQRQFPQFYPLAKDKIAGNKLSEYKKQNKPAVDKQVEELYARLKDKFQDDSGSTYIMELDCWHWARYTENVTRTGHPGDEVIYGRQRDSLMLAPLGSYMHWDRFLYYFSAYLYKFFSLFKQLPLSTFLFYLPLVFSAVFIAVLYLFTYRLSGVLGALLACLFAGLSPAFISRSCAGWFDKDILNLIFPVLIAWTYLVAFETKSLRQRLLRLAFSSFWVGIFCFNWTHWWFVFLLILVYEVIWLLYLNCRHFYGKQENTALFKQHLVSALLFTGFSFFWIFVFAGKEPLLALFNYVRQALILNKPLASSIWPNVYFTVGELGKINFSRAADSLGGKWLFLLSLFSLLALFGRALFDRRFFGFKREAAIIMFIWLVPMCFAISRGQRFIVFLLIPLGVALGWVINDVYLYIRRKNRMLSLIFTALILALTGNILINNAYKSASTMYPLIDDAWYKTLNLVKEKTPPETVLNSWWDFGDWFKVIARRKVIFDGQSQDTPQAYWMAKALLSNNENESIAILRMLNNAGNRAFETIDEQIKDPLRSELLLEAALTAAPEKAKIMLLEYLPVNKAQEVMRILFSTSGRACFIVDNTMVSKMPMISYLGNWNFAKVYIAQNFHKQEKGQIIGWLKNLGWDEQDLQRFYQEIFLLSGKNLDEWFSQRLQFYSGLAGGWEENGVIYFENGFIYSPKGKSIIRSNTGQVPLSLFIASENNFLEIPIPNANAGFSALIFDTAEGYKCILLDRQLANSLFMRLYFLKGRGLKHFQPFTDAQQDNTCIRIFNIVW